MLSVLILKTERGFKLNRRQPEFFSDSSMPESSLQNSLSTMGGFMKLLKLRGNATIASMGLFIAFSAFALVALVVSTSCTAEKDTVRAQDRVDIEQLMWDYIRALDSGNAEAYAALFAPDGQFGRGANAVKGREALKKMILDSRKMMEAKPKIDTKPKINAKSKIDAKNNSDKKPSRMYHVVTNPHIEFIDNDHARYYAYWMGALTAGGTTSAGREVNELVQINGKWLISVRDVDPKD
jgi:hypothetical protein